MLGRALCRQRECLFAGFLYAIMLQFDILSLFPGMFGSPLQESLLLRAQQQGLIRVIVHDLRQYTHDRHRTADDTPYGGGAGMVMKPGVKGP